MTSEEGDSPEEEVKESPSNGRLTKTEAAQDLQSKIVSALKGQFFWADSVPTLTG